MPRTAKSYRLVPAEVPSLATRASSVYEQVIADFLAAGLDSALVEMPGRKTQALTLGLRKVVARTGASVKIVTRAGQVYLQKT